VRASSQLPPSRRLRPLRIYGLGSRVQASTESLRRWVAGHRLPAILLAVLLGTALILAGLLAGGQLLAPQDETWPAMQRRGTWRIGMDPSFPPFEMLDEDGRPMGFDVDLARQMAAPWGLEVEIVAMGFDGLLDALKVGRVDSVVSALPYDPRLTEDVFFSASYFEAGVRLAVREGSPIAAEADLAGRTVAVEWGSAGDVVGRRLQQRYANLYLLPQPSPEEAVDALVSGQSDALLIDGVTLRLAQGRGEAVVAVGPALESDPYVIAAPLQAPMLQQEIAASLRRLQADGTLERLEARWFSAEQPGP
jgi:polar amino acid transport system substrate-binding protein